MATRYIPRGQIHPDCKVCTHSGRLWIDQMLADAQLSYRQILAKLGEKYPDHNLTRKNLSTHNQKHRLPENHEISDVASGQDPHSRYPGKKEKNIEEIREEAVRLQQARMVDKVEDFCDIIINKVVEDVAAGKLKPTSAEGVKAAEIKAKLQQGSDPKEDELVGLFLNIGTKHGYISKARVQGEN